MTHSVTAECPRCGMHATLKAREFSPQARSALVAWGEIEEGHQMAEICGECYSELREVLVERADEIPRAKKAS